ncbi:MAG TPA: hypothetical protein VF613_03370 [Longimicrobium sp.]
MPLWAAGGLALLLAASLPAHVQRFARGFADGRKSAALASSIEYVQGRAVPTQADYAAGMLYTSFARGLPILLILVAICQMRQ